MLDKNGFIKKKEIPDYKFIMVKNGNLANFNHSYKIKIQPNIYGAYMDANWSKTKMLVKNRNFGRKSKSRSKIKIL